MLREELQALETEAEALREDNRELTAKLLEARARAEEAAERAMLLESAVENLIEYSDIAPAAGPDPGPAPADESESWPTEAVEEIAEMEAEPSRPVAYETEIGEEAPTEVSLFYGTNRARTDPGLVDYLKKFRAPALSLLGGVLLLLIVRKLIKLQYRKAATVTVAAAVLALLGWTTTGAVYKTVQMRQAVEMNPVLYGPMRLEVLDRNSPFELGTCTVSIPPIHVAGRVELPRAHLFEFRSDPAKHFVLSDISPLDEDGFYARLKARVAESDEKDMFVFVHGFHNTFEDAAFRTAQIAHDLGFQGAPVFFSWPSQGKVLDYTADENNVNVAVSDLKLFLQQLRANSGAERFHLIAHSMGSRALAGAITDMAAELADQGPAFNELVLAAPDIDAMVLDRMAERMASTVDRVTLYASSKDEALAASRFVHGQTYQRAGETTPRPLVNPWIETIDVSYVTSGHSYIADSGRVLTDLGDVLIHGRAIDETIATRIPLADGHYWQLRYRE